MYVQGTHFYCTHFPFSFLFFLYMFSYVFFCKSLILEVNKRKANTPDTCVLPSLHYIKKKAFPQRLLQQKLKVCIRLESRCGSQQNGSAAWKTTIKPEQGKQRTLLITFLLFKRQRAKLRPLQDSVNDMKQGSPGWAVPEERQERELIGTLHSRSAFPARATKQGLKCHSPRRGLKDFFQEMTMKARNCFGECLSLNAPAAGRHRVHHKGSQW